MTYSNAIKKVISKFGQDKVNFSRDARETWVKCGDKILSFLRNGPDNPQATAVCFNVSNKDDRDDPMTDYSAGGYYRNLSQAIRSLEE